MNTAQHKIGWMCKLQAMPNRIEKKIDEIKKIIMFGCSFEEVPRKVPRTHTLYTVLFSCL